MRAKRVGGGQLFKGSDGAGRRLFQIIPSMGGG